MEGIFGSILYLIPIALFIALRIINAKNKQNKKPPQRTPSGRPVPEEDLGELIRQIKENKQPSHWEVNTESQIPSAAPRTVVPKKPVGIKKKKPVIKQAAEYRPNVPDTSMSSIKTQIETTAPVAEQLTTKPETGILLQGLPPLQQAVVWAEILGQPKALGDNL